MPLVCFSLLFDSISGRVQVVCALFVVVFGKAVGKKVFLTDCAWPVGNFRSFSGHFSSVLELCSKKKKNGPFVVVSARQLVRKCFLPAVLGQ